MRRVLLAILCVVFSSGSLPAKELVGIAAIVNDSVISVMDLMARTKLVALSSGLEDTPELRRELVGPVLQNLIEEKLQVQEAERRGLLIADEELQSALKVVERQNGIQEGKLDSWLASIGLPSVFFRDQLRAQLLWAKVIATGLRPQVNVKEEEIDAELARLRENRGKPEYLVSQIDFYLGSSKSVDGLLSVANELVSQVKAGADFEVLVEQFSDNALASLGGDMGWLNESQLLPEFSRVLSKMEPGQVSEPFTSPVGVHVIKLRDRRRIMVADIGEIRVELIQIVLPASTDDLAIREQGTVIRQIRDDVRGCSAMEEMATRFYPDRSGMLGWVSLGDLPKQFRLPLSSLDVGLPSEPLVSANGVHIMMVCKRENPASKINYAQVIRERMERVRLETLARRLLRDLRRSALVDVRV